MKAYILILILALAGCNLDGPESTDSIPDEVYDLRQIGVNVLGLEKNYNEMWVLYEPTDYDEQQMMLDIGIIAGYMYQSNTFEKLKISAEKYETEIISVTITSDDIEAYENGQIDIEEFKSRWVIA